MKHQTTTSAQGVRPLISAERMAEILSSRRSVSSSEAYRQMAKHLGHPLLPARKKVLVNGQVTWVCC